MVVKLDVVTPMVVVIVSLFWPQQTLFHGQWVSGEIKLDVISVNSV